MDLSSPRGDTHPDERISALVNEFFDRRQNGEDLTPESFIAEHPEAAADLGPYLAGLALVGKVCTPADDTVAGEAPPAATGLPTVEGYKLIAEIGRGGMGVVYKALQVSTKRVVALKVVLAGSFASPSTLRRFEREVELAARLRHPNIVSVLEGGHVAEQPYYAMEYVAGVRLDRYLSASQVDVRTALSLFAKICEAVSAAHLQGVIHRDLKPANVLIDDEGSPHILDFGLAKATDSAKTETAATSGVSQTGQVLGTLSYLSPEQAAGAPAEIDTRADVYALGVILYHMLTGEFPYQVVGNTRDVLDNILRAEPARPSTIRRQIDDEVEAIVLKCLSKERERRYQSAGELARDIGHYLSGEPIEAKRDSALYVLRKQLRRYRIPVVIAAAFVVVVTAGFITSVTFWRQAVGQRDAAEAARGGAEQREKEAAETRDQLRIVVDFQSSALGEINAEQMGDGIVADLRENIHESLNAEAATPEEIAATMASFDALVRRVNPTNVAREVVDEYVLSPAAETIEQETAEQPLVEAALRQTVGDTYRELGLYPQALPQMERALALRRRVLGDDHPDTLLSINNMGLLLQLMGKLAEAEPYYREALEGMRRVLGDDHADTLVSINNMGLALQDQGKLGEAQAYYREALEGRRRVLGDDHPHTLQSISNMGYLLQDQGQLGEAQAYYREALEGKRRVLGDDHPDTLVSINNMGLLLQDQGQLGEAQAYYREALEGRRRVLGDDHPHTLQSISNMGYLLQDQGQLGEAEPYYRGALEGKRRVLGNDHPDTLLSIHNMGTLLDDQGRLTEAEPCFREALEGRRRVLGDEDADTLTSIDRMGLLLRALRRYAEAQAHCRQALQGRRRVLGDSHPATLISANNMGYVLQARGKLAEAEPYYREALEGRRRVLGDDHSATLASINNMGYVLQAQGKLAEAEAYYREALEGKRRVLGDDHPSTLTSINNMGYLLRAQVKLAEAEPYCREALEGRRRVLGHDHPHTLQSISNMGYLLQAQGKQAEAQSLFAAAVDGARRSLPEGHWDTGMYLGNHGKCLTKLKRYDDAEAALGEAYGILEAALGAEHERTIRVIESLAALYDAWGKPEQAANYRTLLPPKPE